MGASCEVRLKKRGEEASEEDAESNAFDGAVYHGHGKRIRVS